MDFGFYKWFDKQDLIVKVVLLIPIWGWLISFLYRLDKFLEHKDVASLLGMILAIFTPTGFFISVIDLITVLAYGKIMVLVAGGENFGINGKVNANDNKEDNEVKPDYQEVKEEKEE